MSTLLIENGAIITVNPQQEVFSRGYVLIDGDRITHLAEGEASPEVRNQAFEIIDATDCIVMPGLVNSHVHLFQTLTRGLSDNRDLLPWLEEVAFPVYEYMTPEDMYLASMVGAIENIRGGATAVTDDVTVRQPPEGFDAGFRAARDTGLRYKMARGYSDIAYPEALMETSEAIIEDTRRLHETWQGQENGRLGIDFSPNVVWSTSAAMMLKVAEKAREWGIGIHIHTAEARYEQEMSMESYGMRQVEWLADLGVLGPRTQLAHAIWLNDREIELVAESGACISHNPVSNMFLASGICPVEKLRAAGIPVALGTDGQAVNDGQEMLDVLKWASNLSKVASLDAQALPPEEVIQMACREGAIAFGQPEQIGSLEEGKKADLILVSMNAPRLTTPSLSIASLLVFFGRSEDVDTVIVDGNILMRSKEILGVDEEALLQEFRLARRHLLQRAGVIPGEAG